MSGGGSGYDQSSGMGQGGGYDQSSGMSGGMAGGSSDNYNPAICAAAAALSQSKLKKPGLAWVVEDLDMATRVAVTASSLQPILAYSL
ncbi:TPA: hypothetical protein ACH3X2_013948 [Trebouxia sp. C0005]